MNVTSILVSLTLALIGIVPALAADRPIPEGNYVSVFSPQLCGVLTVNFKKGHSYKAGTCTSDRKGAVKITFRTKQVSVKPSRSGAKIKIKAASYEVVDVSDKRLIGEWRLNEYLNPVQVFNKVVGSASKTALKDTRSSASLNSRKANGPFLTDETSIRATQAALNKFGYKAGPADGVMGRRTKKAISAFRKDAALPTGSDINNPLLLALDVEKVESNHNGDIYVSTEPWKALGKRLEQLERDQVLAELEKLKANDRKKIDLVYSKPKSIIFVLNSPIKAGSFVRTYASNIINGKNNSWSSNYTYPILDSTSTEPLVIVNEFETGNPMFLIHKLIVGADLVAQRLTRADR